MGVLDWLLLAAVGVWLGISLVRIRRKKGTCSGCCGTCAGCAGRCNQKKGSES